MVDKTKLLCYNKYIKGTRKKKQIIEEQRKGKIKMLKSSFIPEMVLPEEYLRQQGDQYDEDWHQCVGCTKSDLECRDCGLSDAKENALDYAENSDHHWQ